MEVILKKEVNENYIQSLAYFISIGIINIIYYDNNE